MLFRSDVDTTNTNINISDFKGEVVTGTTHYVKAYIADIADGTETTANTKTLFVRYLNTSNTIKSHGLAQD